MANYQNLLNSIAAVIKTNGNQEITGAVLQSTLQSMVSVMGANATYGGVAHPADSPGTPDGAVIYIASEAGIYTNFSALEVDVDELAVLVWNPTTGTWSKESVTYIADKAEIEQLIQDGVNEINDELDEAIDDIDDARDAAIAALSSAVKPVIDVTMLNSGATYSSLVDALHAIPSDDRLGGLTVKFKNADTGIYEVWQNRTDTFNYEPTNWASVPTMSAQGSQAQYDIEDPAGYMIARFAGGDIRTKNFDSSYSKMGKLKILIVGNSYSADSFMYLPFILLQYGIKIEIGIIYHGGYGIDDHIAAYSTASDYGFFHIDTEADGVWSLLATNKNPQYGVQYTDWNMVVLQQSSIDSVTASTYDNVHTLMDLIFADMNSTFIWAWNINHTRKANDDPSAVLTNCEDVNGKIPTNMIFPYGTAIFNARQDPTLSQIGDGGNLWCNDNVHLQEGLPCYIATITNVQAIFNKFYPNLSVIGNDFTVDDSWVSFHCPSNVINGSVTGMTSANCELAQKMAIMANRFNYEIKTLQ